MIELKKGGEGKIEVWMFCDISTDDIYVGIIKKHEEFYRFYSNETPLYCKAMMAIGDELAILNKG